MSASRSHIPQVDELERDLSPEDLFITLYRCAMAGLGFGDTVSWRLGQSLLARHVPAQNVGPLFGQFYGFARAVIGASQGLPSNRPVSFRGMSAEEALALRMIEMSQRSDPVAVLTAAAMLVGDDDLGTSSSPHSRSRGPWRFADFSQSVLTVRTGGPQGAPGVAARPADGRLGGARRSKIWNDFKLRRSRCRDGFNQ